MVLGKLYRWMNAALKTRKDDVVRRKAKYKRAVEDRENKIDLADKRAKRRVEVVEEAEEKFKEDHKDEIEAYYKGESQDKQDYGNEDGEAEKPKEALQLPVFKKEEFLTKWDEENPSVAIPPKLLRSLTKTGYLVKMMKETSYNNISLAKNKYDLNKRIQLR